MTVVEAGHHGGAWKVAYADFVTAMMAFFLLLWLLNVTTDEEKNAISNYFDPTHPQVSDSLSGAGGVMGGLSMTPEGSMATNVQNIVNENPDAAPNARKKNEKSSPKEKAKEKAKEILRKKEDEKFKKAEDAIKQAIQESPELAELAKNLMVDMTPEGLRIQIVDQEGKPMFASGSARMYEKTKTLMTKIATIVKSTPNDISVRGHTDSVPYGAGADYTNWELSSDRANASRRVILDAGIPMERVNNVVGKADTDHLLPDDPNNAQNRRISIILLKEELTNPDFDAKANSLAEDEGFYDDLEEEYEDSDEDIPEMPPIGTFRKTPGSVEFP
mgnify:CR=1 FL=1